MSMSESVFLFFSLCRSLTISLSFCVSVCVSYPGLSFLPLTYSRTTALTFTVIHTSGELGAVFTTGPD
jgi:hypothetical protein